jgi:hypothetical protein
MSGRGVSLEHIQSHKTPVLYAVGLCGCRGDATDSLTLFAMVMALWVASDSSC